MPGSTTPEQRENGRNTSYHTLSYAYQTYLQHDPEEINHWEDVCRSYRQYATFAMAQWANSQYRLHALPEVQRKVLPPALRRDTPEFDQRAKDFKDAAIRNQFCLDCILRHAGQPHSQESTQQAYSTDAQMSKVSSVLKSLARDWSADGKPERDLAYQPLLEQMKRFVPIHDTQEPPCVCVPGAGVGRLALELSALGYTVQGNEFSLYMLLASDFILNGGYGKTPFAISPWLLESRNVHEAKDPTRKVLVPDVDPFTLCGGPTEGKPNFFSVSAGEFASIYSAPKEKEQWDAVVACFVLDASPSIIEILQVIHQMLKPGGMLLNFGPLLWHWSGPAMRPDDKSVEDYQQRFSTLDSKYLTSVDLTWEDISEILANIGFEIVEVATGKHALYTADRRSMMNVDYRCINFVARKTDNSAAPPNSQVGVDDKGIIKSAKM